MNLILIIIDCLRADHLSCLGYSKRTTPNLDKLAGAGVLFSQAISVSHWTAPSFISLFTSTYPLMYGGKLFVTNRGGTITQALKEHGYATAAFHSNPWLSSYWGYHRGFDTFDDGIPKNISKSILSRPRKLGKKIIGNNGKLYEFLSEIYNALVGCPYIKGEDLNKKAISWLHDNQDNFFLWMHYMDVHQPYLPTKGVSSLFKKQHIAKLNKKAGQCVWSHYLELHERTNSKLAGLSPKELKEIIALYDARVSYVDDMIDSLLRMLKQSSILNNTFVIITADHGQQFMEHGNYGHRFCLYDELIRVPLIIFGPGLKSNVISQQISLLDLAPTILDILKLEKPNTFLGDSLLPLIDGCSLEDRKFGAISEADMRGTCILELKTRRLDANQKMISLRTAKWKYIYTEGGQDELYCLGDDPKETKNVIAAEPDIATELRAKIMAHIEFEKGTALSEEELIKAKIRKLKGNRRI